MTTQTDSFFANLAKCPYELPEGIKPHLIAALKATYGEGTAIAQKKAKQETGYNRFVKEKTVELKAQNVASDVRMKQIRELWHALGEQGQNEYTIKAGGTVKPKPVKAEETPAPKAEAPIAKDETLAVKVEVPQVAIVAPIKKLAILKAKVEAPVAKAEAPVAKVEEPVAKVEVPVVVKAEEPVTKKAMVKKTVAVKETPATPVVEAPVAKVETPVTKAEAPITLAEGVVVKAETEAVKAKVPIVKTGAGYNHFKKVRAAELANQEKGLSGTDRMAKVNAEWKAMTEAQKIGWTEKAPKA